MSGDGQSGAQDVPPFAAFGSGSRIAPPFTVTCPERIRIGANVNIGTHSWLSVVDAWLGRHYEPELLIGDGAVLDQPMSDPAPVTIGDGAFLGVGAIILPGVAIGPRAYVAAGAVVATDVPAKAVVAGNPAQVIRTWDEARQQWRTVRSGQTARAQLTWRVTESLRAARRGMRRRARHRGH